MPSWTRRILLTVVPSLICYLAIGLPLTVIPGFMQGAEHYGIVLTSVVMASQYLATCLLRPWGGRIVDRHGPKRAVLAGLSACALSGLALMTAAACYRQPGMKGVGLSSLFLSRMLIGLAESWTATGVIIWGMQRVAPAHMTQAISWNGIASYGGLAIGAPIGATLIAGRPGVDALGTLGLFSLALGVAGVLLVWPQHVSRPINHGKRLGLRAVVGLVLPHSLALGLGAIGFGAISSFLALYYSHRDWAGAGTAFAVFAVCFIINRFVFGHCVERFGGYRVAGLSMVAEAAGLTILALAPSQQAALVGCGLSGAGFSLVSPALGTEAVHVAGAFNRGAALSVFTLAFDIALGLGGPCLGSLVSWTNYRIMFLTSAALVLTGASLASALSRRML